ncbi:hypothetical protein [uncultured Selenomonas sp.]|uniref:hypothetical protein n=1 Tax=uncultured Selenomonas sp. TaxID=159275 RepID=UPI0028E7ABB3|nr:hypothetical protein [uncultured Selenomonas sp.]
MAASSLLISESPLTVQPNLAVLIGLNEAIFLQQLQYWISREAGFCDQYGRRWIYNTVKQWHVQFPFWSESTIKRIIKSLEDQKAMLSTVIGNSYNKTKAYTVNYALIEKLSEKIVHEQFQASVASADRRISIPPPTGESGGYTEERYVFDTAESEHTDLDVSNDDDEGQKIKVGEPWISVKMTPHEEQDEPRTGVNLTPQKKSTEPPVTARVYVPSSRTRVTETTTTENTHRIRETTTGDVRSLCAALGISDTLTENFLRRYGEECVYEKARLLEIAMQTQSIRNPTGWLHAALKNGYTFSPRTSQQEEQTVQPAPTRTYIPPESDSVEESLTQPSPVKRPLHEFLTAQASGEGEVSMFAQEYLRRHGNPQGRASP